MIKKLIGIILISSSIITSLIMMELHIDYLYNVLPDMCSCGIPSGKTRFLLPFLLPFLSEWEVFFRALDLTLFASLALISLISRKHIKLVAIAGIAWVVSFLSGEVYIFYSFRTLLYATVLLPFIRDSFSEKFSKFLFLGLSLCAIFGFAFNFDSVKTARDFIRAKVLPRDSLSVANGLSEKVERTLRLSKENPYPDTLVIIINKSNKALSLVGFDEGKSLCLLETYKLTGFSGKLGPKMKEFDRQMPEGVYEVESYNPNSKYHLSLRLNYPNDFDKKMAELDGREIAKLGGDIMIHGRSGTVGCFPVGDVAIEEIFTICRLTKTQKIKVIIAPFSYPYEIDTPEKRLEYRRQMLEGKDYLPDWYPLLLDNIWSELENSDTESYIDIISDYEYDEDDAIKVLTNPILSLVIFLLLLAIFAILLLSCWAIYRVARWIRALIKKQAAIDRRQV